MQLESYIFTALKLYIFPKLLCVTIVNIRLSTCITPPCSHYLSTFISFLGLIVARDLNFGRPYCENSTEKYHNRACNEQEAAGHWYIDSITQVAVAAVDITLCYLNPKQSGEFAISFVAFRFHNTGFLEFLRSLALLFQFYV